MIKRLLFFFAFTLCMIHLSQAQDDIQLADTLVINGETIIMLGDSVIIIRPEKPVYWKKGGNFNLSIQQVSLTNWAAGGASNMALNTGLNLFANFKKDEKIWDNNLTVNFGFNRQGDREFATRKTNDNFIFISKYGRELTPKWYLSTQIDARTQLLGGYRYFRPSGSDRDARQRISDLLAPAYIQSSTGLNFKKEYNNKDKVSVIASPFTGRFTIVMDDSLSRAGAFGVIPGETIRAEAGVSLSSATDIQILENIRWRADLNLFSSYERLGNMVVNLNSIISMKVNRYITTRIETVLIYDERVMITRSDDTIGPAIQLQNLINFGIGIDF
ncbi:DUF3078 domain-containing protein [Belliella kenyensis]|uniref:DUF3078 domain-containing protein n=1 Tax=Belliella kenyensis TaxID=1472724 RepID=A0ABV8ESK0_9BACT|nr:DUF3078 domain-containing protein [Belliella kenyensis]MCH7403795.1 DUF3078 domain-containing protein [Belliella kenyensis]MDN3602421.1 DUF3078 domain-containing protein [Belliella kenyensis]